MNSNSFIYLIHTRILDKNIFFVSNPFQKAEKKNFFIVNLYPMTAHRSDDIVLYWNIEETSGKYHTYVCMQTSQNTTDLNKFMNVNIFISLRSRSRFRLLTALPRFYSILQFLFLHHRFSQ